MNILKYFRSKRVLKEEKEKKRDEWKKSLEYRYPLPRGCRVDHANGSKKRDGRFYIMYRGNPLITGTAYADAEEAEKNTVYVGIPEGVCKITLGISCIWQNGNIASYLEKTTTVFLECGEVKLINIRMPQKEVYLSVACYKK